MKIKKSILALLFCTLSYVKAQEKLVDKVQDYVQEFNNNDSEAVINKIPNKDAD